MGDVSIPPNEANEPGPMPSPRNCLLTSQLVFTSRGRRRLRRSESFPKPETTFVKPPVIVPGPTMAARCA